jgi:hypothetical protein
MAHLSLTIHFKMAVVVDGFEEKDGVAPDLEADRSMSSR